MKQEWDLAEQFYQKAGQADPENATVWNNFGLLAHQRKDYAQACLYFQKAFGLEKKSNYLVNEGNALAMAGKFQEAKARYEEALGLQPDSEQALHSLAKLFVHLEQHQDAKVCFQRLADTSGKPTYRYELALHHIHMGEYTHALGILCPLANSHPNPDVWFQIGRAEFSSKNHGLAEKAFKAALAEQPDNREYRQFLSMNFLAMGQVEEGLYHLDMLIKLNPTNADLLVEKGVVLCGLNEFEAALQHFQRAINLQPDHEKALRYQKLLTPNP